jgi:hypothetical protein
MGERPETAPLLPSKGMGVSQRERAAVSLPDMADNGAALNRIGLYQLGNGRVVARRGIFKGATALVFVKGDAPAVPMRPPRCIRQVKLKQISVGTFALMPNNLHMELPRNARMAVAIISHCFSLQFRQV